MTKKVKCSVEGCCRKGQSSGEYLCPDCWAAVSAQTKKQYIHLRSVAQRTPLPINRAAMKSVWRKAVSEANANKKARP